jgi:hypothetical protein
MNRNQFQHYQNPLYQSPAPPSFQRHLYSGRLLAILTSGYIVSWLLYFAGASSLNNSDQTGAISTLTFLGVIACIGLLGVVSTVIAVLIFDWHGLTTMNGWIKWGRMKVWQKIVFGYFFIGFSMILVAPYLIQVYQTYRQNKQQAPIRLRHKIAEQEAQLGIVPQTDGTCRNCQKPLQIGAEFCAYCGVPVIERPRICPNCATTTLPDAQWCPKCRTRLTPTL